MSGFFIFNRILYLVDVSKLKNATSQPKISIANVNYEVFGTGNIKLTLGEKEL